MGTEIVKPNLNSSEQQSTEDVRLYKASIPVTAVFGLFLAHIFTQQIPSAFPLFEPENQAEAESHIFPVLVEQLYRPKPETQQFRALSDVTAEGKGRITLGEGFHTLSDDDTVEVSIPGGRSGTAGSQAAETRPGRGPIVRPGSPGDPSSQSQGDDGRFRIPSNYRFRKDFVLAYDGSPRFSVARQELAGFKYFQNMFRRIRETFAPPGLNYAYQDMAGTVVNQPIKPQIVEVAFLIDDDGNVRDVKKISSMGQDAVDRACMETLIGQNFGKPPPEIFANGHVFGIGFVFPAVMVR